MRYALSFIFVFILTLLGFHFFVLNLVNLHYTDEDLAFCLFGISGGLLLIFKTKWLQAIYIFFHELAHAFAVLLSSGKIHEFKVTSEFGYVKSDQTSFFIRLAPYFLPFFPLLLVLLNYPTLILLKTNKIEVPVWYHGIYLGLFSLAFLTQWFYNLKLLRLETSDVSPAEVILSLVSIFCAFFFTSTVLFFLVFNQDLVLKYIYFL